MRIEHEEDIAADPAVVWALTIDVERWPDITPKTISSIELLDEGPIGLGSRARIKQPGQRARIWTVRRFEPEHCFVWDAKLGPLQMAGHHTIEETASGCRNKLAVEFSGPGAGLFGRLARRTIQNVLATENAGFKEAAESRQRAASS